MWHKLVLLSLYILVLFFLSRLLEAAFWYHGDHFISHSVLDPLSLSVTKLHQLLSSRGVSYATAIEKDELIKLVLGSGEVTKQELFEAIRAEEMPSSHQTVHFTCGSHFYEEVEDTKDSVWLVQVVADENETPILDAATWKEIVSKVGIFGVRTGIFKCSLDEKLCARKGWNPPLLFLALPRSHHFKEDVVMHNYFLPSKKHSVLKWLHQHLSSRVTKIPSVASLKSDWLSTKRMPRDMMLRVIYISTLSEPPLFISALAIKFNGRIQFGIFQIPKPNHMESSLHEKIKDYEGKHSTYLVSTPERVLHYGRNAGEIFSYKRMELFLKSMHPEMNDVFLMSLFLINIMIGLEFFLVSGRWWRHCIRWFLQLVKFNCMLFLFWLLLLGASQFKIICSITSLSLKCVRTISEMPFSTIIRNDWSHFYSLQFIAVTFVMFGLVVALIWKKLGYSNNEDPALFSDWWSVPWDGYIMNYFFRPMVTLTRPMTPQDFDLEDGLELFIERLAVPNLWLLPIIQMDYIKDLPVWKYCGVETEDDTFSQDEGNSFTYLLSSSDDESNQRISRYQQSNSNLVEQPERISCFHSFKEFLSRSKKNKKVFVQLSTNLKSKEKGSKMSLLAAKSKNDLGNVSKHERLGQQESVATTSEFQKELSIPIPTNKQQEHSNVPVGMIPCTDCSICLESYHQGESLCGLPCGHNYHLNCIMLWITRDNHCCPICRWPSFKSNPKTSKLHSQ